MKKVFFCTLIILLFSCKAKQVVLPKEQPVSTTNIPTDSSYNIIKKHYEINRIFTTCYIKSGVDYKDPNRSLGLSADIRIKKDEIILVSVKILGITMAKAIITPDKVRYYEKMGAKYFDGDFKTLSNWLGTDLDFQKAQNMLLGQAMDNLNQKKYETVSEENAPKLIEKETVNIAKAFVFYPNNFYLKRQEIAQTEPAKKLNVNYLNYKTYPEGVVLPEELLIFAIQKQQTTTISMDFKSATFNEDLAFPYEVPSGYERIIIK